MSPPTLHEWIPRLIRVWRGLRSRSVVAQDAALSTGERNEIVAAIGKLSLGLTRDRELAGAHYLDDPILLGAYLLFYWPISYAQTQSVLAEVPHSLGRVLDVGAGPAPLSMAAYDLGATAVLALERSARALEIASQLADLRGSALVTKRWSVGDPLPDGEFDTILVGHLLNELSDFDAQLRLLENLLDRLSPTGSLVVIEPALRTTSRALLSVRDRLVKAGFAVRAPCLFRGDCPALVKESDWCHAERAWSLPPLLEELSSAARLHKEKLKFSYLVLASRAEAWPAPPLGRVFRIVSEPLHSKGQSRYVGCGPEGRLPLVQMTKHVSDESRAFLNLDRGRIIRVDDLEQRGTELRLTASSRVELVGTIGAIVKARGPAETSDS